MSPAGRCDCETGRHCSARDRDHRASRRPVFPWLSPARLNSAIGGMLDRLTQVKGMPTPFWRVKRLQAVWAGIWVAASQAMLPSEPSLLSGMGDELRTSHPLL